ncbi:carbohydrate ABC transporter permease [Bacillus sp. Marseille-P3661]|uniref:carbohydrate ABC transporter permease n=1 Tax=Bacillus sp. Marseille-P3661 TaxID=1936234 RepID=UPI000C825EC5|nr:sugar ABC transporter permease [Bacillus sp. Marseille-P3661]
MRTAVTNVQVRERQKVNRRILKFLNLKKYIWPYAMLSPTLVILAIFFVFPFFFSLYLSFMQWNLVSPTKEFVGFFNYSSLLTDDVFWMALKNTMLYVFGTVPLSMIIAIGLAVLIESTGRRIREIYRFLLFIPVVASIAVTSIVWMLLMNPDTGLINNYLSMIGLTGPNWLNDPKWALWSLMIVGVWKAVGYNMVLYIAGLKGIDTQLYEAAEIDGAGSWKKFISITLPQLSPVNMFVLVVSIINSFQVFATVHIMTSGGPNNATNVLIYQVWQEAFQFFDIGRASALSMILFIIVLVIAVIQIRLIDSKVHYS